VKGLKEWKPEDRPGMVGLIYYSFRIMVGIGFLLAGLMALTVIQWVRGKLASAEIANQKWLLIGWIFSAPLGYIAIESGWIVRCVGRQPWTMYDEIRTVDAASNLPPGEILTSLLAFSGVYSLLFISALFFGSRIIRQGPNFDLPIPKETLQPTSVEHTPDRRPVES
jgi:cytochrome d ubiquinol oxidase subunit I